MDDPIPIRNRGGTGSNKHARREHETPQTCAWKACVAFHWMRSASSSWSWRAAVSSSCCARPPAGLQNGRVVTPTHWEKIGGIFAKERWAGDSTKLIDEEETQMVHVSDARTAVKPPSLAREGFELRKAPTTVRDFFDDATIRTRYYDETAELVRTATGAKDVVVFQHMRRDTKLHNKESQEASNARTAPAHGAVSRVHADYTPSNGPHKLQELVDAGVVSRDVLSAEQRWSIVNVWRNTDPERPVLSTPLAVLDASTVAHEEMFSYALVNEETSPPLVGFNNGVGFSQAHAWYYYSRMAHDEALLLYTYDGSGGADPRFVFHSAFDLEEEEVKGSPPPRQSIECRCLALF